MHFSAPGKLFISGEWTILEVGNYGLVAAVNNRVRVSIDPAEEISVTAEEFDIRGARADYSNSKISFPGLDEKSQATLKLLGEALSVSLRFLEENNVETKPFRLTTSSRDTQFEVNGQLKKVGFGSSAAVVVAAIAAVLDFHGYAAEKDELYKLSTIAHYYAQGKVGSAFDVAASTYGGLFVYSRFDPGWLTGKVESGEPLKSIVAEEWPSLVIEPVEVPNNFILLVGWTGESASTSAAIKQMNEFKAKQPDEYYRLFNKIASNARRAIEYFKSGEHDEFFKALNHNEDLLRELGEASGVSIETPQLRRLSDIAADYGAAGKLSGAGGGDCGIAICFDDITANNITAAWQDEGLIPLDVTIDLDGVRKE
ncbi:MAG: phosphomevalonate kinase [Candidatus Aenigmarchaeota archaeon]|nr:phosphomevalonate kinase [Candidatus Aenigmarchaeota archaeon]